MLSQFEPLVEGHWVMGDWTSEESGMLYGCETCDVIYNEKLLIDLHLAGLRHMKTVEAAELLSSVVDSASETMTNVGLCQPAESASDMEQCVENEPAEVQDKKLKVADILSRNFNAYQKLTRYVEPVLGVDYISEFRFLSGQVEYACNLCEVGLNAGVSLTEHASSLKHLLRYIFYHDSGSFKLISLADKCSDLEFIRTVAADIESKQGRQLRTRVFIEPTSSPPENGSCQDSANTSSRWLEQKDDLIRPVTELPGHSANVTYGFTSAPDDSTPVRDVQSLLDALAYQSCVAHGKPPSLLRPVTRMDLLFSLAAFEISNDSDAEVSLQIANTLTLALLSYRMKSIPALKVSDRSKLEQKLVKLREDAEVVAEKTRCRHTAVDQHCTLP